MIRTGWSAGLAAVLALAAHAAAATNACTGSTAPLQINPTPVRLPAGVVGKAYRHRLHATGGVPPYTFHAQTLPPGFTLSADGTLQGKASPLPLLTLFTVRVCDKTGAIAQQTFRLAIVPPWHPPKPKPRPAPKPKPKPTPKPEPIPPPKPAKPAAVQSMVVYELTPAMLKRLKPKANSSGTATSTQDAGTADPSAGEAAGVSPEDFLPAIEPGTGGASGQATGTTKSTATKTPAPAATSTAKSTTKSPSGGGAGASSSAKPPELAADVLKNVQAALKQLEGVEYPGRDLFRAALTARLCAAFEESKGGSRRAQGKQTPAAPEAACASQDSGLAAKGRGATKGAHSAQEHATSSPIAALRDWLIKQAGVRHEFPLESAPKWSGAGCGCVHPRTTSWLTGASGSTIMGFYPLWRATKTVQKPDFNIFARLSVFGLTFDTDGKLIAPNWTTSDWAFVRQAHLHHTQVDFTLYRADWSFLKDGNSFYLHGIATSLARNAAAFIDTPVPGLAARSHRWLPGFAATERVGNGLTLYLRPPAASSGATAEKFRRFRDMLIRALIRTLRRRGRQYTLNIVMRGSAFEVSDGERSVRSLAQYIALAGGAASGGDTPDGSCYGRSAVKVCYLVMLSEPLEQSAARLRNYIETTSEVSDFERVLIRSSIIPVISTDSVKQGDLGKLLARFSDWFGGAGFWPIVLQGSKADKDVAVQLQQGFSYPARARGRSIAALVCVYRWPLRGAFEGLLALWLIAAVAYKTSCRVQKFGLRYLLGLLIGAVVVVLLGAVLLTWDPALSGLRKGNALLAVLLLAIIAVAGYQLFKEKTRVDKP